MLAVTGRKAEGTTLADDDKVKAEAEQVIGLYRDLPRLVLFDLDYTLWPFYWGQGIDVAIASRSPTSEIARRLLHKLNLRSMFIAEVALRYFVVQDHFLKMKVHQLLNSCEYTIRVNTGDDNVSNPKKDFEFDRVYGPHVAQGTDKNAE